MPQVKITASMLYDFVQCPHRVTLDLFEDPANRDPVSPFVEMLWERGNAYEAEVIDGLGVPFVNLRVVPEGEREQATAAAMAVSAPLIYGGRIASGDLLGEPDLLRFEGRGYVPGDIKSGAGLEGASDQDDGKPKRHYAVQLALYADILRQLGVAGQERAFVWDVHGEEVAYDFSQARGPKVKATMWEEYRSTLGEVRGIVNRTAHTTASLGSLCKQCHWRSLCEKALEAADDLTLVPDLGRSKRAGLLPYVHTVAELAKLDPLPAEGVPGIGVKVLERFRARARLQKLPGAQPAFVDDVVLPGIEHELFFDIETDPMRDLCYLHGFVERIGSDPETEKYVPFFAADPTPEAERDAFAQAWAYVKQSAPSALYVYSAYEKTWWKGLARRYPEVATEAEVDALFESPWVVDLYFDLVLPKMVWPTRDHSIKTLAKFWGFKWRDTDPSGAASIEWYDGFVKSGDANIRTRILEYNEDDCRAMRVLVDGVRRLRGGGVP